MTDTEEIRTEAAAGYRGWLAIYLKGAAMGTADAVPGVSGGTIALIVGVYERLISALTALDPRALRHLSRLHTTEGRAEFAQALLAMDVPFLGVLGVGVMSAVALVSSAMHVAAVRFPVPTYGFFFGLIAASAYVLRGEVHLNSPARLTAAVVGFLLAFIVSGASAGGALPTTLPVLFLSGAVAITAMILPGISGAFILFLLGQYEFMTGIPSRMADAVAATIRGEAALLSEPVVVFLVFCSGALVGLLTVAHVVRWALERRRHATLTFLVALMIGALRAPIVRVQQGLPADPTTGVAIATVTALIGAGLVLALDRATVEITY